MWPKLLAQLFEVLPHVSRLLPLADRFFQNKAAGDEANLRAFEAVGENLRGELGKVTASHAGVYRQLNEQSEKLSGLAVELGAAKAAAEATGFRMAAVEARLAVSSRLIVLMLLMNVVLLGMVLFLLLHHR